LKERDAKLAELTQKAADLENTILDMQENLREKDAVIEARTQAITLLSEDLSKKRKCFCLLKAKFFLGTIFMFIYGFR